ncbi:hypothetical protein HMPREF2753_06330 [Neisseria sp. HMSC071C03]|nr:hypothetical protein HMPREF3054_04440 [Neisseria sp. HMSC071B12]OHR46395.1 hypothetical protein HMPREF2753_06330 [Neisseria sp. HMSC071C03]
MVWEKFFRCIVPLRRQPEKRDDKNARKSHRTFSRLTLCFHKLFSSDWLPCCGFWAMVCLIFGLSMNGE